MTYKLKRPFLLISLIFSVVLIGAYLVATAINISRGYNASIINNTYVSVNKDFSYEFIDEKTVYKYTPLDYFELTYILEDGVYLIQEEEEEFKAIALNFGKEFYVMTINTYMYRLD